MIFSCCLTLSWCISSKIFATLSADSPYCTPCFPRLSKISLYLFDCKTVKLCSFLYCPISRQMRSRLLNKFISWSSNWSISARKFCKSSVVVYSSRTTSLDKMASNSAGRTCCFASLQAALGLQCDSTISLRIPNPWLVDKVELSVHAFHPYDWGRK